MEKYMNEIFMKAYNIFWLVKTFENKPHLVIQSSVKIFWIPVTSRMKLLTNQIFYGWMCSAGTIGGEYDRRQRCSKHETGSGESVWSSWEIRLQVVFDSNKALSKELFSRTSDGAERISFGELFKINELISSRFSCILESAKLNR